jgi:hypothetical protein
MLAAAIRSHRLLAAINAARFGSCIGNCFNSRCIASKKRLAISWLLTTGPPPARLAAMAATACSPISATRESANANLPGCLAPRLRDSVLDWRVGPRLVVGFDPPIFSARSRTSAFSSVGRTPICLIWALRARSRTRGSPTGRRARPRDNLPGNPERRQRGQR